mmetsp:Transcript_25045/g.33590  ORF Transcript_25045/g.33590 Transcript_25045/m.33590 type:complete len:148 (-) Transcript_25045:208-651(-)
METASGRAGRPSVESQLGSVVVQHARHHTRLILVGYQHLLTPLPFESLNGGNFLSMLFIKLLHLCLPLLELDIEFASLSFLRPDLFFQGGYRSLHFTFPVIKSFGQFFTLELHVRLKQGREKLIFLGTRLRATAPITSFACSERLAF